VPAAEQVKIFGHATTNWYVSAFPGHKVRITRPFYLSKYEITQAQWQTIVGSNPSKFKDASDSARRPVESVLYPEIGRFLSKLQKHAPQGWQFRLPTEAEWEYAARAGADTFFSFGDSMTTSQACFSDNKGMRRKETTVVGSFPANAWGCHDMQGNVWEYCADLYDETFYTRSPVDDPLCTERSESTRDHEGHILRGGSWNYTPPYCRFEHRGWDPCPRDSTERWPHRGIRVVLSLMPHTVP